jgi:hypothetical protein
LYSFKKNTNVSKNTFLGLLWPTGSYVASGMRMTVSSMFFVLIPLPWHPTSGLSGWTDVQTPAEVGMSGPPEA